METILLKKLPAEIRVRIYELVFSGNRITINIAQSPVRFSFSPECGFAFTCRAIRDEASETIWRSAIVKASNLNEFGYGDKVNIDKLTKVLPDEIARNITQLRNVYLPTLEEVRNGSYESATASLARYPMLRVCCISIPGDLHRTALGSIDGTDFLHYLCPYHFGLSSRLIVPFTCASGLEPKKFIQRVYGLRPDCGIQILSRESSYLFMVCRPPLAAPSVIGI